MHRSAHLLGGAMLQRLPVMRTTPYTLPPHAPWPHASAVAEYALACLESVGLGHWSFGWDRAVKRMGCCYPARTRISLSAYYVEKYLQLDQEEIRNTILHEIAHALAWHHHRARAHGHVWRHYCNLLGLEDASVTKDVENFTPEHIKERPARWVLCHAQTGEVFRHYKVLPRRLLGKLHHCYIPGRMQETLGQLVIRPV